MRGLRFFLWILILASGCTGGAGPSDSSPSPEPPPTVPTVPGPEAGTQGVLNGRVSFSVVDKSIQDDPQVERLVAPFRARMGEEIQAVIGETNVMLSEAVPEGTLGNFATDAMLWAANRHTDNPVHMALTNNGGLRIPIGPGPITVGQMYELMPFENKLTVLVLTGSQIQDLCDELAEKRGEPIAGFSFRIEVESENRVARQIMIGGQPLDREAEYRLVTNDYMANGGDSFTPLLSPVAREDFPILLRDAFIDYVRHRGVIEVVREGRITGGIGR